MVLFAIARSLSCSLCARVRFFGKNKAQHNPKTTEKREIEYARTKKASAKQDECMAKTEFFKIKDYYAYQISNNHFLYDSGA